MITNKVAKIRKEKKMTQEFLANKIGISRCALSEIENGTVPTGENMLKIAQILKCAVEEIFLLI